MSLTMADKSEIDRLSSLPDNILSCNIFSHLSLRDVVRTSILSRRWRFLWKQIPHLDFSEEFFQYQFLKLSNGTLPTNENHTSVDFAIVNCLNDIIGNILLLHSGHIERFSIHVTYSADILQISKAFKALRLEEWIHHAAQEEVKHLSLKMSSQKLDIPPSLFACNLLRDLELESFRFTGIPTDFGGFRSLQSCCLSHLDDLTDDGLKQLIGLCPLLHKLVLASCLQLNNLKIEAPNLNSLILIDFDHMESLTVDCPQLVELEMENCYRQFEFKMNSCVLFQDLHTSDNQIPKVHPMLNSLRKLSVKACPIVSDLSLLTILGCFHNLEEVHIQICEKHHWEQKAKGEVVVVADSSFPSLKKVHVDISSEMKKEEAIMLAFLLDKAPSLNTITVALPYCPANIHDKKFINKVRDLQLIYEKVVIRMKIHEWRYDAICMETGENDF